MILGENYILFKRGSWPNLQKRNTTPGPPFPSPVSNIGQQKNTGQVWGDNVGRFYRMSTKLKKAQYRTGPWEEMQQRQLVQRVVKFSFSLFFSNGFCWKLENNYPPFLFCFLKGDPRNVPTFIDIALNNIQKTTHRSGIWSQLKKK